jgi:proteasome lid subunit RPN8/RPN11
MSEEILTQYEVIIENFPDAILVNEKISHLKIELIKGITLEIDFTKYPKKPKVKLFNQFGKVYKKANDDIECLKNWKSDNTNSVLDIINEIQSILKDLQSNVVKIKRELVLGFLALSRGHHPRESLGILKMENNVFTEYILPPGAVTSRNSGIFNPVRMPVNRTYQGSFHSHPSGVIIPSLQDLNSVFKRYRYNFIVGYPYDLNNIRCFDKNGNELQFKVID